MSNSENECAEKAKGSVTASASDAQSPRPMPRPPLRVLIVEDEAIIAMELEMLIEEMGAEVVGIAGNADEAERLAASCCPDLITMDIHLKGERDGVSAALSIFKTHGIRSVFVSAYCDVATVARAALAEPLGWVKKPIEKFDLEAVLEDARRDS